MYLVNFGPRRNRRFDTMHDALVFCNCVFARTGIVLSIVKVP